MTSDDAGNLFGVTEAGGRHGAGTVFEVTPAGVETILHNFEGTDGAGPGGRLFRDKDGTLYGTTAGGARDNAGTVFRLNVNGAFKVLHEFSTSNLDGGTTPGGGVVLGRGGFLYGTTTRGGQYDAGTAYRIKRDGSEQAVIYSFTGGASGNGYPEDTLTIDAKGNFYGTTGDNFGQGADVGAVFKLKRSGDEKVLHTLTKADGYFPSGALAYDASGNLYGTTGGEPGPPDLNAGTIFKITP